MDIRAKKLSGIMVFDLSIPDGNMAPIPIFAVNQEMNAGSSKKDSLGSAIALDEIFLPQ